MKGQYWVYILTKLGNPFYVGMSKNPFQRLKAHNWVYGAEIQMELIAEYKDKKAASRAEMRYIKRFYKDGLKILNKMSLKEPKVKKTFRVMPDILRGFEEFCKKARMKEADAIELAINSYFNDLKIEQHKKRFTLRSV